MSDTLKIVAVFLLLLIMLRRRINFGVTMLAGSIFLALLYLLPPAQFVDGAISALTSGQSVTMIMMLYLTMVMENILRNTGTLKRLVGSVAVILPDKRWVMMAMPAMVGLLPSLGGAVFSAPMVLEASAGRDVTADQKAFVNYWFRHPWEYVSPLYPGLILVSGVTHLPFWAIAPANAPCALTMLVCGIAYGMRVLAPAPTVRVGRSVLLRAAMDFALSASPVIITLLLVVLVKVHPVMALGGMVAALYLVHRYSPDRMVRSLMESLSLKMLFMVCGIMIFKEILGITGALTGVSGTLADSGLPPVLLLVLVPFVVGVMTGLTVAFVGVTFPILMPLMGGEPPSPGLVAVAFAGGFAGVMLSPLHLCLILTGEYFGADLPAVYRRLWLPSAVVLAASLVSIYTWCSG